MTQKLNSLLKRPKMLSSRRLTLLGSVAGLGIAAIIAGPGGYNRINLRNWGSGDHQRKPLKPLNSNDRLAFPVSLQR
jgi:hypothetical protein